MSACSGCDQDERSEDGDLGLGRGCQPGSLPSFEILRRPRPANTQQSRPEPAVFRDSDETSKRPKNPLMKLTTKLGFYPKPKSISPVDDNMQDKLKSDAVVLGTSLKQHKLVFNRDMMNIQRRRSVDQQQRGTPGILHFCIFRSIELSQ